MRPSERLFQNIENTLQEFEHIVDNIRETLLKNARNNDIVICLEDIKKLVGKFKIYKLSHNMLIYWAGLIVGQVNKAITRLNELE